MVKKRGQTRFSRTRRVKRVHRGGFSLNPFSRKSKPVTSSLNGQLTKRTYKHYEYLREPKNVGDRKDALVKLIKDEKLFSDNELKNGKSDNFSDLIKSKLEEINEDLEKQKQPPLGEYDQKYLQRQLSDYVEHIMGKVLSRKRKDVLYDLLTKSNEILYNAEKGGANYTTVIEKHKTAINEKLENQGEDKLNALDIEYILDKLEQSYGKKQQQSRGSSAGTAYAVGSAAASLI
jgi:hypothetical protein